MTIGTQCEVLKRPSHAQRTCWESVLAGSISCSSKQFDDSWCLVADELGAAVKANVSHNAALPRKARDAFVQQQQDTAKQSYHGLLGLYILMLHHFVRLCSSRNNAWFIAMHDPLLQYISHYCNQQPLKHL